MVAAVAAWSILPALKRDVGLESLYPLVPVVKLSVPSVVQSIKERQPLKQKQANKIRQGVYIAGLAMEAANRTASIIGKPEPVRRGLIYGLYKLGRWLKR